MTSAGFTTSSLSASIVLEEEAAVGITVEAAAPFSLRHNSRSTSRTRLSACPTASRPIRGEFGARSFRLPSAAI